MQDARFVAYMQMFGIEKTSKQSFLRVNSELAAFKRSIDYLTETALPKVLGTCVAADGFIDKELVKECTM